MAAVANQHVVAEACPACSSKSKRVAPLTVRSLLKPEPAPRVREEPYRFCPSPGCDVVYFSETEPEHRFVLSELRVRLGQKETEPPIQVCYCFDWTTDDIERELRLTGTTSIPDRIKQLVRLGYCRCETMNPQGSCCLGNVNRAVQEAQAGLAALLTAVIGSACCWLPLLLIAVGFSAAGVGSFFEQYRPYLLSITFALLGLAWWFMYRAAIRRARARLRRERTTAPSANAAQACEDARARLDCCAVGQPAEEGDGCCGAGTQPQAGQATPRRFTMRQFNQVMLWAATIVIMLFALFPHWIVLLLPGAGRDDRAVSNAAARSEAEQQRIVLEVRGMTCAACAKTVEQALRGVSGVLAADVSFEQGQAVVWLPRDKQLPHNALVQAVRRAGYEAAVLMEPPQNGRVYRLELGGLTCESCAEGIEQALRQVPGVLDVEVSHVRSEAVVKVGPGIASQPEELIQAVRNAGFRAALKQ
ncbi:MAG: cation transporter [Pirellulales bacterium]|nr:cation transporter [Pirellulales bacterium]